jgi:hypothetical protein
VLLAARRRLSSLSLSVTSRGLAPPRPLLAPLLRAALHSRAACWVLRQWYGAHRGEAALVRRLMRGVRVARGRVGRGRILLFHARGCAR